MGDVEALVLGIDDVLGHHVGDLLTGIGSALGLLHGEILADDIGDDNGLNAEEIAEEGLGGLDAACTTQILHRVHSACLVDLQTVSFHIGGHLSGALALGTELGSGEHHRALTQGAAQGVYAVDLVVGILLAQLLGDQPGKADGAGEGRGAGDVHGIHACL